MRKAGPPRLAFSTLKEKFMSYEITLLLCENCFDAILEEDAEYHDNKSYCNHCIEKVRS